MQAFSQERFPVDISYAVTGGPEYSTDVIEMVSGYEQRNSNWQRARNRYNAAHGVKTKEQLGQLIAFFRARRGRAIGFRFKDWTDYQAFDQKIGIGDGEQKIFQLVKHYISGDQVETRIITKPVAGTIQIFVDYKLQEKNFTVDINKGLLIFDTPPAINQIITAHFEFDVPVRFDTDRLNASIDNYGVYSWQDIPLIEVFA